MIGVNASSGKRIVEYVIPKYIANIDFVEFVTKELNTGGFKTIEYISADGTSIVFVISGWA